MALFGKKKNEPLPIEKARFLSVEDQTFILSLWGVC